MSSMVPRKKEKNRIQTDILNEIAHLIIAAQTILNLAGRRLSVCAVEGEFNTIFIEKNHIRFPLL